VAEPRRRVVLTGAAGRIGRAIAPQLADRWDLQRTDLLSDPEIAALDITDLEACRSAFAGADAVVHLAAVPDPEATWEQLLPANVIGTYNVAQAAGDAGVRRLVLASSLHAVGGLPDQTQRRADGGTTGADGSQDHCGVLSVLSVRMAVTRPAAPH
jgi:nucleoside-diphosphate-sugar epimerase